MAAREDITVYWGVASGSSHAAMHNHYEGDPFFQDAPEPTHLMINWQTANNQVWEGPTWMIDSGGAPDTIKRIGGHPDSIDAYLDYIESPPTKYGDDLADIDIAQFALRDWPCEPSVQSALGLTVEQLQHRTLVDHINMMNRIDDMSLEADPVAVLQGHSTEDYLNAIDMYRDHGLLTDTVAIGTLCGRDQVDVIQNVAWRIARNLPARVSLHGFGVKQSALRARDVLRIFDSVDTLAWDQDIRQATKEGIRQAPPGLDYEEWEDWEDDGNPRYTARNLWINYRQYARRLADLVPEETPSNVRVVTIDQFADLAGHERPEGQRVDEYVVFECLCGQILDPGRPDPTVGPPQCRHCERLELDIQIRRIDLEDHLRMSGEPEAPTTGDEPETLDEMREAIQMRLGEGLERDEERDED